MAGSAAFSGWGTTVEIGNASGGSSSTWKTVEEVNKVEFSGDKVDLDDVTHMQSPGARREFITTLIDDGEMALDMNNIPGDVGQLELKSARDARSLRDFRVTLPLTLGVFTFNGYVTGFTRPVPHDKHASVSVKVKITSSLEFA